VELATLLAARSTKQVSRGSRWLDNLDSRPFGEIGQNVGLIELCERCEAVELWIDPVPNAQLILIWLLDYLRPHQNAVSTLSLVQANAMIGDRTPKEVTPWGAVDKIRSDHLEIASAAWQAYRAPTPQTWSDLLGKDLSVLPQLGHTILRLLEELPGHASGLGATEMRMLELISEGAHAPV